MISRCDVMYGAVKTPSRKTIASSSAERQVRPSSGATGTSAISGARNASERSIVVRAPSRAITEPLGMPSRAIGSDLDREHEAHARRASRVVTSTNHGSATNVIAVPVRRDDLGDDERATVSGSCMAGVK